MRELPAICAQQGLRVPRISDDAAAWLQSIDADALETLTVIGCPEAIGVEYRGLERIHISNDFDDLATSSGDIVGEACIVLVNAIELVQPYVMAFVITSDARIVNCRRLAYRSGAKVFNSNYDSFLVFSMAIRTVAYGERDRLSAILPELARVDPWAFEAEASPWPRRLAEQVFGDMYDVGREAQAIVREALSS